MSDLLFGFFTPWAIYAGLLLLHLIVPARHVVGYVHDEDTGEPLRYRLNGLPVLLIAIGVWFALGESARMPWVWLWTHRWSGLAAR